MDRQKLLALLQKSEGTKLDFKEQLNLRTDSEKKELAKDVCAIANSKGGRGYIIYGVEDHTKRIIGIDEKKYREEQIQQIIGQRCDPPVQIAFETVNIENKALGVLLIYRSNQKPHQIRQTGTFYIRRGSTTDIARREEIAAIMQEMGLVEYEKTILSKVNISELNELYINNYISQIGLKRDNEGYFTLLEGIGIIGKEDDSGPYHPTIGGLLVFGRKPQAFLSHTGIKLVCKYKAKEIRYFSGPIFEMLEEIEGYIKNVALDTDYPIKAFMEAVANAVIHRDYYEVNREIVIIIDRNKIEINNPGSVCCMDESGVNLEDYYTFRRNQWLYQSLLIMDSESRFTKAGLGIKGIQRAFKAKGKVSFINDDNRNLFKVILPGILS